MDDKFVHVQLKPTTPADEVCDFCSSPSVAWSYPARDVSVPSAWWTSRGGWAACDGCHDLIEKGDWSALARKSVDTMVSDSHGRVMALPREVVYGAVEALHETFRKARDGEAVPHEKVTES